jgi:hypothetical protein
MNPDFPMMAVFVRPYLNAMPEKEKTKKMTNAVSRVSETGGEVAFSPDGILLYIRLPARAIVTVSVGQPLHGVG